MGDLRGTQTNSKHPDFSPKPHFNEEMSVVPMGSVASSHLLESIHIHVCLGPKSLGLWDIHSEGL